MLGVLVCQCGTTFAAMSIKGPALPKFGEAVTSLGWINCDFPDKAKMFNKSGAIPNSEKVFSDYKAPPGVPNPFGVCAAPKLLQQALKDGHVPIAMSERLYRPHDPQKGVKDISYKATLSLKNKPGTPPVSFETKRTFFHDPKQKYSAGDEVHEYSHGVASCTNCQIQLTLMLCGDKKECSKKS
jgi:hypothetical protein